MDVAHVRFQERSPLLHFLDPVEHDAEDGICVVSVQWLSALVVYSFSFHALPFSEYDSGVLHCFHSGVDLAEFPALLFESPEYRPDGVPERLRGYEALGLKPDHHLADHEVIEPEALEYGSGFVAALHLTSFLSCRVSCFMTSLLRTNPGLR